MISATAAIENVRLVRYCQMSITTIVIYDHLLSLSQEAEYIWKRRWSSSKFLYLGNRYIGHLIILALGVVYLNPHPTPKFCQVGVIWVQWLTSAIVWNTQIILVYRIHAMYGGAITVMRVVAGCFAVEVILMIWLVMANQIKFRGVGLVVPADNDICAITHVLSYKFAYWIPVIAFEALLCTLAVRAFIKDLAENRALEQPWRRVSLLTLLVRDNIIYFVISLFTYTATLTVWLTCPPTWWQIPAFYSYNGTTILGCRLVLNLCEAFYGEQSSKPSPWDTKLVTPETAKSEGAET